MHGHSWMVALAAGEADECMLSQVSEVWLDWLCVCVHVCMWGLLNEE